MRSVFKNIFFKLVDFFLQKADQYAIGYYKHLFGDRLELGLHIKFRRNSSIVFLDRHIGSQIVFGNNCEIRQFCIFTVSGSGVITVDDECFFNNHCTITALGEVRIGKNCLFGEGVRIYDHNHKYKMPISIREQGFTKGKVSIGDNCWFGSNCVILNNVTIGDNVVVGANTLVYKSIPSNTVVRSNQSAVSSVYR